MPTLFVLSGPQIGRSFEVGAGAVLGRAPQCDVPLVAPSVSRRHARLERAGELWSVVDLGSRNGVLAGDRRVARLELVDGAVFRLGDVELRFRLEERAVPSAPATTAVPSAPAPTEPPRAVPPPSRAAPRAADGIEAEEIVLEGADETDETDETDEADDAAAALPPGGSPPPRVAPERGAYPPGASAAPRSDARRAAPPARPRPGVARRSAPLAADVRQRDVRPALQYSRVEDRGGFFTADLSQYPAWLRIGALLLALILFAGIFLLAFRGTAALKLRGAGGTAASELEGPP